MFNIFVLKEKVLESVYGCHVSTWLFSSFDKAESFADENIHKSRDLQWVTVDEVEVDSNKVISSKEIMVSDAVIRQRQEEQAHAIMQESGLSPRRRPRRKRLVGS